MAEDLKTPEGVQTVLGLRPGETPIYDPERKQLLAVPAGEVQTYLDAGRQLATFEQLQERAKEKVYGNREIVAGGLGAARGLTFGLSDLAARGLGEEEFVREIKERNKGASLAGEITGIALPLLLSAGTGLVAKGAQVGGAGVLGAARAGRAAESALASALGRGLATEGELTLGREIALRALPKALGSATEAAFYGAGQAISEEALGDHELAADKFLAHVGLNSLLAGGLGLGMGAALGTGEVLVPRALRQAQTVVSGTTQKLRDLVRSRVGSVVNKLPEEQQAGAKAIVEQLQTEGADQSAIFKLIDPREREKLAQDFTGVLKEHYDALASAKKEFETVREEAASKLLGKKARLPAIAEAQKLIGQTREAIYEMQSKPAIYAAQDRVAQLGALLDEYGARVGEEGTSAKAIFDLTDQYRKRLAPLSKFDMTVKATERDTVQKIAGVYRSFADSLTSPQAYGKLGEIQGNVAEAYSKLIDDEKAFQTFFARKYKLRGRETMKISPKKMNTYLVQMHKNIGSEADQAMKNYLESSANFADVVQNTLKTAKLENTELAGLRRAVDSTTAKQIKFSDDAIKSNLLTQLQWRQGIANLANLNRKAIESAGALLPVPGAAYAAKKVAEGITNATTPVSTIERLFRIERMMNTVDKTINSSIESFLTKASSGQPSWIGKIATPFGTIMGLEEIQGSDLDKRSQELSTMLADQNILQQRLASNLGGMGQAAPNLTATTVRKAADAVAFLNQKMPRSPFGPNDKQWRPSDYEAAKFERYYAAAMNPLSVMADLEKGVLNVEGFEAIKKLHPGLYAGITQKLLEKMTDLGDKVPYDKRVLASMILESPVEKTMDPSFIASIQSMYAQQTQARQAAQPPRRGVKTQSAQREATMFSRVQNRGG